MALELQALALGSCTSRARSAAAAAKAQCPESVRSAKLALL
jgi:hypothetical protein